MNDFFISYNRADKAWAEWIAWILEEAGYTVIIDAWDFRAGENFVLKMNSAARESKRTIAIISDAYLSAEYTHAEWAAAFAQDPQGEARGLIPVKVSTCEQEGLLGPVVYVDLTGLPEEQAKTRLLESLKERAKPDVAPAFPRPLDRAVPDRANYPGDSGGAMAERAAVSNLPAGIPLFVGRNEILDALNESLRKKDGSTAGRIQALTGLGGIGKTQTAIEYARRHAKDYKALLWAVAESAESLRSDFGSIAALLVLPEANLQDQASVVNGVKRWLAANDGWLLILDNADDPALVAEFIPQPFHGSILLTSRAQVFDNLGIFNPLELESMSPAEAREFLMRRSGLTGLDEAESRAAQHLASELDYLPLALEQAGAYVRELQGSFSDYLGSYRKRGLELLEKRYAPAKYGKSIRTTWALNFQQIAESSNASADFLRVSAFLSPDRIPTEFFGDAAEHLGPDIKFALGGVESDPLVLDELIKPPVNFSLIHRDRKTRTFNIHRLVQAVVMEAMDEDTKILWINRVVNAFENVLLDVDSSTVSEWGQIERLVPHVQRIADLAVNSPPLGTAEAVRLFNRAGRYLHLRGRLSESEKLYDEALRNAQQLSDTEGLDLASSLHNKGWLYNDLGQYDKAEPLLQRALVIRENRSDVDPRAIARNLNRLGVVYDKQGRFQRSRRSYDRALEVLEEHGFDNSIEFAEILQNLANLQYTIAQYSEAEKVMQKSISIFNSNLPAAAHHVPLALSSLGMIMFAQGESKAAETNLRHSISAFEALYGTDYPRLAFPLTTLAVIYRGQGRYEEAEALLDRSLKVRVTAFGLRHPEVSFSLEHLAILRLEEHKYAEAEDFLDRALSITEEALGQEHPYTSNVLIEFVRVYLAQKKYSNGESFARRAFNIRKNRFGLEHLHTSNAMLVYAQVLRGLNRKGEAQRMEARGRKIQAKLLKKRRK